MGDDAQKKDDAKKKSFTDEERVKIIARWRSVLEGVKDLDKPAVEGLPFTSINGYARDVLENTEGLRKNAPLQGVVKRIDFEAMSKANVHVPMGPQHIEKDNFPVFISIQDSTGYRPIVFLGEELKNGTYRILGTHGGKNLESGAGGHFPPMVDKQAPAIILTPDELKDPKLMNAMAKVVQDMGRKFEVLKAKKKQAPSEGETKDKQSYIPPGADEAARALLASIEAAGRSTGPSESSAKRSDARTNRPPALG